jgi:hypothetical protein
MCTIAELNKALQDNNQKRNNNLDEKLQALKLEIFEKVDGSINARIKHNVPAPETLKMLEIMKDNCSVTSNKYNTTQQLMQEDLKQIRIYMAEDKVWKKEFSQSVIDRLKEKADQKDIDAKDIAIKKDIEDMEAVIEKLKQFRWQTLAIVGVAWALFEKFL